MPCLIDLISFDLGALIAFSAPFRLHQQVKIRLGHTWFFRPVRLEQEKFARIMPTFNLLLWLLVCLTTKNDTRRNESAANPKAPRHGQRSGGTTTPIFATSSGNATMQSLYRRGTESLSSRPLRTTLSPLPLSTVPRYRSATM